MKVLIYENRKYDPIMYDISTPEKESAAFLDIFDKVDESNGSFYQHLRQDFIVKICDPCRGGEHNKCVPYMAEGTSCGCDGSIECERRLLTLQHKSEVLSDLIKLYEAAFNGSAVSARKLLLETYQDFPPVKLRIAEVIDPLKP